MSVAKGTLVLHLKLFGLKFTQANYLIMVQQFVHS